MKILTKWLRSYLPEPAISDTQLTEDLTLHSLAVEGIFDLGPGKLAGNLKFIPLTC